MSAPPQIAATGAGLTTTGGGRKDATWRPMLIVALVAAGLGIGGTRFLGRGAATPPSASSTPSTTAAQESHTPPAGAGVMTQALATPDVDAGAAIAAPTSPSPTTFKTPAPPPVTKRHGAPAASASTHPPAAASATPTRQQGSDDDIR